MPTSPTPGAVPPRTQRCKRPRRRRGPPLSSSISPFPVLAQARKSVLEAFFKVHNLRSATLIDARIEAIKASKPLNQDVALSRRIVCWRLVLVKQIRITLQPLIVLTRGSRRSRRHCRTMSKMPIPSSMAATNTMPLTLPLPTRTRAGPGHIPAMPHSPYQMRDSPVPAFYRLRPKWAG